MWIKGKRGGAGRGGVGGGNWITIPLPPNLPPIPTPQDCCTLLSVCCRPATWCTYPHLKCFMLFGSSKETDHDSKQTLKRHFHIHRVATDTVIKLPKRENVDYAVFQLHKTLGASKLELLKCMKCLKQNGSQCFTKHVSKPSRGILCILFIEVHLFVCIKPLITAIWKQLADSNDYLFFSIIDAEVIVFIRCII